MAAELAATIEHAQTEVVQLSARIEMEIGELDEEEAQVFRDDLGLEGSSLERVIRASYTLLGLISFFTAGADETRAWTVARGATAVDAAGTIHTDLARGFIRAEVIGWEELLELGSMAEAKTPGQAPLGGQDLPGAGRRRHRGALQRLAAATMPLSRRRSGLPERACHRRRPRRHHQARHQRAVVRKSLLPLPTRPICSSSATKVPSSSTETLTATRSCVSSMTTKPAALGKVSRHGLDERVMAVAVDDPLARLENQFQELSSRRTRCRGPGGRRRTGRCRSRGVRRSRRWVHPRRASSRVRV